MAHIDRLDGAAVTGTLDPARPAGYLAEHDETIEAITGYQIVPDIIGVRHGLDVLAALTRPVAPVLLSAG